MKYTHSFFWVVILFFGFFVASFALAQMPPSKDNLYSQNKRLTTQMSASCPADALEADVVAIDHPMIFNRLGAQNVNWMMYALRHDLIYLDQEESGKTRMDTPKMIPLDYTPKGDSYFKKAIDNNPSSRNIALRPDLLVVGIKVGFTHWSHFLHRPCIRCCLA